MTLVYKLGGQERQHLTGVWQKWRFCAPHIHLWLIKVWLSASTFVVKIATCAKRQTVNQNLSPTNQSLPNKPPF
jgi:hypothetical protein